MPGDTIASQESNGNVGRYQGESAFAFRLPHPFSSCTLPLGCCTDLVVLAVGPQPSVLTEQPPVAEIVSPDDSHTDIQERAHDYR
jgi:hypothetical protein